MYVVKVFLVISMIPSQFLYDNFFYIPQTLKDFCEKYGIISFNCFISVIDIKKKKIILWYHNVLN